MGQWPYVDVWDRKPLGLFIIYACAALFDDRDVYAYQVFAGLFTFGTALLIWRIGLRFGNSFGALAAAIAYTVTLTTFEGAGGQSPVFYNALIAGAALLVFQILAESDIQTLKRKARAAMLLCGLAMFIKQTSLFEGAYFGSVILLHHAALAASRRQSANLALQMICIALAPNLIAFACYATAGNGQAYLFANFRSIFLKHTSPTMSKWKLIGFGVFIAPLTVSAIVGALMRRYHQRLGRTRLFMLGWLLAAVVGVVSVPNFYPHYLLPLLAPLSVSAATLFGWSLLGPLAWVVVIAAPWVQGNIRSTGTAGAKRGLALLVAAVDRHLGPNRTMTIFDGPPLLFQAVRAVPVSRFVFPDHLVSRMEADGALGVNQTEEVRRILDLRPSVIVTGDRPSRGLNADTVRLIRDIVPRRYSRVAHIAIRIEGGRQSFDVWSLRSSSRSRDSDRRLLNSAH